MIFDIIIYFVPSPICIVSKLFIIKIIYITYVRQSTTKVEEARVQTNPLFRESFEHLFRHNPRKSSLKLCG
jgi:hypothetical protein